MLTIDAQVHAYERNHPGRPWAALRHGPAEVTGDDMVAAVDAVGLLTYKQGVDAFRGTDRLSDGDKATLIGGALQRVYRWSPRTA